MVPALAAHAQCCPGYSLATACAGVTLTKSRWCVQSTVPTGQSALPQAFCAYGDKVVTTLESTFNIPAKGIFEFELDAKTGGGSLPSTTEFVLNALPTSFIGAFAENSLLQVLILACLVGAALLHLGHTKVPKVLPAIEQAQEIIFAIVGFVMRLAPLAVFGAMAVLVGQYGLGVMKTYAKLIILCYVAERVLGCPRATEPSS